VIDGQNWLSKSLFSALVLTVARGIFFSSKKPIFVVAGSVDLSKRTDVVKGVFDSMICVGDVPITVMERILDKRIKCENNRQSIQCIFDKKAIEAIYNYSCGFPKDGLRLAANSLTEAAIENEIPVKQDQVNKAQSKSMTSIGETLELSELRVFEAIGEIGESSPSYEKLQERTGLSRPQLDRILRRLYNRNIIQRRKEGRSFKYYM
jgi:DNA-binding transcriptional ArsR family regulator